MAVLALLSSAMKRTITFLAVALSLACTMAPKAPAVAAGGGGATLRDPLAFDRANMNPNGKACDDFYDYTYGGWLATHDIPPEYTAYGVGTIVGEENRKVL